MRSKEFQTLTRADGIIITIIAEIFEVIRNEQRVKKQSSKGRKSSSSFLWGAVMPADGNVRLDLFDETKTSNHRPLARNGVCKRLTEVRHKLS